VSIFRESLPGLGVLHGCGTMWIDIGARIGWINQQPALVSRDSRGIPRKIRPVRLFFEPGTESASQQTGADTPSETRMTMLKFRSLITALASLLATVTAIVIALLPAMLTSAT
jgi:hypothetical protein